MRKIGTLFTALAAVAAGFTAAPAAASDPAMEAAARSTRTAWNAIVERHQQERSGTVVAKALPAPPVINSMRVTFPGTAKISTYPAPIRIRFDITSAGGVRDIMVDVRSRDYKQGNRREILLPNPHKSGAFFVNSGVLTSRNQPGNWDIRFVGVCDVFGQCTEMDFYGQEPVSSQAFVVENIRPADLQAPTVSSAVLNTPSVTTSSTETRRAVLTFNVADNIGVAGISVCARPPSGLSEACGWWELPALLKTGAQRVSIPFEGNGYEAGTWTIEVVEVTDGVGNQLFEVDPTALDTMFPGGRTFTLANGS